MELSCYSNLTTVEDDVSDDDADRDNATMTRRRQ